jgi:hypothetical protein
VRIPLEPVSWLARKTHRRTPKPECERFLVVRREDYVFLVPFVEDEHTVFPLRKLLRIGQDDILSKMKKKRRHD